MDKHYKYGIINGDKIVLFNETIHEDTILTSDFLTDVTIEQTENGILDISANRIIYDFYGNKYGYRIFEKDWKHTPHPKEIHEGKRWWFSKKKERFVYHGWIRSNETEPMHYMFSKYKIEIYE